MSQMMKGFECHGQSLKYLDVVASLQDGPDAPTSYICVILFHVQ